jgi:hypothetical protein
MPFFKHKIMKRIFLFFGLGFILVFQLHSQVNVQDSTIFMSIYNYWEIGNVTPITCVQQYPSQNANQWCQIDFDSNGRLTSIYLGGTIQVPNKTLSSTIGNLSELQNLSLQNNHNLTGPIPPEIGNLINLKSLSTENCEFIGPLPPEMGNLYNLEQLTIGGYANAQFLSHIGLIPTTFQNLNKLKIFYMSSTGIKDNLPGWFCMLDSIKRMNYCYNPSFGGILTDSVFLSNTLKEVELYYNAFYGPIPDTLGPNSKLHDLDLSGNHFSGTIPASICNYHPNIYPENFSFSACYNDLTNIEFIPANSNAGITDIRNNKFQFGDFENIYLNGGCWNCIYSIAPQDSVWSLLDTTALINTTVTLSSTVTGQYNMYCWYKNGILVDSNTLGTLVIPNIQHSDSGVYTCNITNQYITPSRGLILNRWPITIHVVNSLTNNEIAENNLNLEIFPNPINSELKINLNKFAGEPFIISLINSTGKIIQQTTTIESEFTFNTKNLGKGLYLVKVEKGITVAIQRVVKE